MGWDGMGRKEERGGCVRGKGRGGEGEEGGHILLKRERGCKE